MFRRSLKWSMPVILALALASQATLVHAVDWVTFRDVSVCEGSSGRTALNVVIETVGPNPSGVTGIISSIGNFGTPATPGSACASGVDFVNPTNVSFTIPANTTSTTVTIDVCGDLLDEPNESFFMIIDITSPTCAVSQDCCLEGTCIGVLTIRDDDDVNGPGITINDISISEPFRLSSSQITSRTANFTVSLDCPSTQPTTVTYRTRDGTARIFRSSDPVPTCFAGDYAPRSGTLTIPAGSLTGTIPVTVCGDLGNEPNETFFVDLSSPVNGRIFDGTGQATIKNTSTLQVGGFELSPSEARLSPGDIVDYQLVWTMPEGEVWRDLSTIDFRIRNHHETLLWVRWDEPSNTFSVCEIENANGRPGGQETEPGDAQCTAGGLPGSDDVLRTSLGALFLDQTSVVGSGPTGQSVTLNLALSLLATTGEPLIVEVAAADDAGHQDPFIEAGELRIDRSKRIRSGEPGVVAGSEPSPARHVKVADKDAAVTMSVGGRESNSLLVHYSLSAASHVEIAVYDITGRRVATLDQGPREAGPHTVRWSTSGVATGMYFYRLRAGDVSVSKSVLVLR